MLATLDEFESTDVLAHAQKLSAMIEEGLLRLTELDLVTNIRGEGVVWGVECAGVGGRSAEDVANACVEACYLGDASRRAIHLLGPLAGKVLRVSPPLVMDLDEARKYFDVMYEIFAAVEREFKQGSANELIGVTPTIAEWRRRRLMSQGAGQGRGARVF